jgi:hypothetical protein
MTIKDLITLTAARLSHLNTRKADAERVGNAQIIADIDGAIAQTEATIASLRTLIE